MPHLRRFVLRLKNFIRPFLAEEELSRELESHLALIEEDYRGQGMSSRAARAAARQAIGGLQQAKELHRDARSFQWLEDLRRDAKLALRALSKRPAFTAVIVVTLAIGIGATVAIFSLANALWLRPLHAPNQERLVRFAEVRRGGGTPSQITGPAAFRLWTQQTTAFDRIAGHWLEFANLTQAAYPEQIAVGRVTASFLDIFGATSIRGRLFTVAEDHSGSPLVIVIGEALWRRQFRSDPSIVGRVVTLAGQSRTVVGVVGVSFQSQQFEQEPDAWVPLQIDATATNAGNCIITGRLHTDMTVAAANAQLAVIAHAQSNHRDGVESVVVPLRDALVGDARTPVLILGGAVLLLLLIAAANVAGLLLVRSLERRREITIQTAVGAGRGRIVRQVLTESLVLAVSGGIVGLTTGVVGIRLLLDAYENNNWLGGTDGFMPRLSETLSDVTLDWRVIAFAVGVTVLTALVFGLLPALHAARLEIGSALKGSRSGGVPRLMTIRSALVATQIALTVVLLTGAGLLVRTSVALLSVDRGYNLENVLTMRMAVNGTAFETPDGLSQLSGRGAEAVRSIPGISAVTTACCVPLDVVWQLLFVVEGRPLKGTFHGVAGFTFVSPRYFETLGIPQLRGRSFTTEDAAGSPPVIVINEAMARQFWPGRDPLGEYLVIGHGMHTALDQDPPRQIVGIVGNVREQRLNVPPRPAMYVPMAQLPASVLPFLFEQLPLAWIVRTSAEPRALGDDVRRALEHATAGLPVTRVRTMREVAAASIVRTRFDMFLMSIFGAAAAFLAALGIYGFMSLLVNQGTRDIGIRMALGARASDARRLVWGRGLVLIMAGVLIGLACAWVLARVLTSVLFGVTAHDAIVFALVPSVLVAIGFVAVWVPASRAGRLDPAVTLRYE